MMFQMVSGPASARSRLFEKPRHSRESGNPAALRRSGEPGEEEKKKRDSRFRGNDE